MEAVKHTEECAAHTEVCVKHTEERDAKVKLLEDK